MPKLGKAPCTFITRLQGHSKDHNTPFNNNFNTLWQLLKQHSSLTSFYYITHTSVILIAN